MRRWKSKGISSTFAYSGMLGVGVRLACAQHRAVQHVLQAGLEVAVQVRQREHAVVLLQHHVAVPLQDHVVHRQRAGLVGAQHVHRAEVLDGVDPLDDHLLAAHGHRALRQADRHDHRQHLGRQPHGHREREEERLAPVALGEPVDDEDQRHHHQHEAQHQPREPGDALVEGRLRRLLRRATGPCRPGRSLCPVATTTAVAEPLSTLVPRNAMLVSSIGAAAAAAFFSTSNFSTGKRLARERALDHEQVLGRDDAHVGRESCPRRRASPRRREPAARPAISWGCPSRITVAVTEIIALSFAAALSALASWTSFRPTLRTIISDITIPARKSPVAKEMRRQHREQDHQRVEHRVPEQLADVRLAGPWPARWGRARPVALCGLLGCQARGPRLQPRIDARRIDGSGLHHQRRHSNWRRPTLTESGQDLGEHSARRASHPSLRTVAFPHHSGGRVGVGTGSGRSRNPATLATTRVGYERRRSL